MRIHSVFFSIVFIWLSTAQTILRAEEVTVRISVPEQRLYVLEGGQKISSYRVSTSKFGLGNARRSYTTPLGTLAVSAKIGAGAEIGTVFKGCRKTGEVIRVNARGRDPIVTRILRLRGLEKQNASAASRGIYIHGTPEERRIGRPASYGCVRMRSKDVIQLFDTIPVGTKVEIINERVGNSIVANQPAGSKPGEI